MSNHSLFAAIHVLCLCVALVFGGIEFRDKYTNEIIGYVDDSEHDTTQMTIGDLYRCAQERLNHSAVVLYYREEAIDKSQSSVHLSDRDPAIETRNEDISDATIHVIS